MLALFRALPLLWRVASIVGLLSAAGGALWALHASIRADGYRDGYAKAEAKCAAEQERQAELNRIAIAAAGKRLTELNDQLSLKDLQLDDYLKANDLIAAAQPDADLLCLPPDSVRRLGAVQ